MYNLNQTIKLYSTNQLTLEHIHVTFEGQAKCKGMNAVFHNFVIQILWVQIALIQCSGGSLDLYGQPVLTFDKRQICSASCVECLNEH